MPNELQRMTVQYSETEDRVRLIGALDHGEVIVIWLTRRLLQRLIPVMLKWLETREMGVPRADALQGFAQQVARAQLAPQPPVTAAEGSTNWLADSATVTQHPTALVVVLRSAENQQARLTLEMQPLRHWFNIMHDTLLKADWPLDGWPVWLRESNQVQIDSGMALH